MRGSKKSVTLNFWTAPLFIFSGVMKLLYLYAEGVCFFIN